MSDERSRNTFTPFPGDPFCGNCGYSFVGLSDSARCPECGRPIVEVLMRRGLAPRPGVRYRSKATLLGLPVIDVAFGPFRAERIGKARGIVAIGDSAFGWLAIGGVARGVIAVGGVAVGVFAIGGLSVGVLTALGGLAVSLGIANGGMAIGGLASGGMAVGVIAQGGFAVGVFARGGFRVGAAFPRFLGPYGWLLGSLPRNGFDPFRPLFFTLIPALAGCLLGAVATIVAEKKP